MTGSAALAKRAAAALLIPSFCIFVAGSIFQAAAPLVMKAHGVGDAIVGLVVGAIGLGRVLAALPAGWLSIRLGPRWTYAVAVVICAAGFGVSLADPAQSWLLLAAAVVIGAGSGAIAVPRTEILQKLMPVPAERSVVAAQMGGLFRVSYMVGPLLGAALMENVDSRVSFASAFPFLTLAVVFLLGSREATAASDAAQSARAAAGPAPSMLMAVKENRGMVTRVGVYCSAIFALRSCRLLLITLVALRLGWTESYIGIIVTVSYSIDAFFFWVGAWTTNKFGRRPVAALLPFFSTAGYALLSVTDETDARCAGVTTDLLRRSWNLLFGAMLFGVADCFGSGLLIALVAECPRPTVSALMMIQDLGQLVGPIVAGAVSHQLSTRWAAFVFAAVAALMVLWAVRILPDPPAPVRVPNPLNAALAGESETTAPPAVLANRAAEDVEVAAASPDRHSPLQQLDAPLLPSAAL
jgi:MFS family permease